MAVQKEVTLTPEQIALCSTMANDIKGLEEFCENLEDSLEDGKLETKEIIQTVFEAPQVYANIKSLLESRRPFRTLTKKNQEVASAMRAQIGVFIGSDAVEAGSRVDLAFNFAADTLARAEKQISATRKFFKEIKAPRAA